MCSAITERLSVPIGVDIRHRSHVPSVLFTQTAPHPLWIRSSFLARLLFPTAELLPTLTTRGSAVDCFNSAAGFLNACGK